jgi:hypothetical protein
MIDPFLHLHKVGPGLFEFSGLRTANIRDQMLRAYLAVKRCAKIGLIGEARPLLVLGGGAAGVTAAMTSAELGIPVVLYEKKPSCFTRQAFCSRHLDPNEYDWPADHWRFPDLQKPIPLPYVADKADALARKWRTGFDRWRKTSRNAYLLTVNESTDLNPNDVLFRAPDSILALDPHTHSFARFGAALSCVGFANERVHASKARKPNPTEYQGFPFWEWDPYDDRHFYLNLSRSPTITISGGGDGALQDFIRVLTGLTAKACYQLVFAGKTVDISACLAADEEAHRAYPWHADPRMTAHSVLAEWHRRYVIEAKRIFNKELTDADKARIREEFRDAHVTLVHGCDHFDFCYGLNRLLVLLLTMVRVGNSEDMGEIIVPNTGVDHVTSPEHGHACGDPVNCHGITHHVTYKRLQCHGQTVTTPVPADDDRDIVILRHGVVRSASFGEVPVPNQTVPYWLDEV